MIDKGAPDEGLIWRWGNPEAYDQGQVMTSSFIINMPLTGWMHLITKDHQTLARLPSSTTAIQEQLARILAHI